MAFEVRLRDEATDDLATLPKNLQRRVVRAMTERLETEPDRYGRRLRRSLAGLWKLRVGDLRIVFDLAGNHVTVWAIMNRRMVYEEVQRRARHG